MLYRVQVMVRGRWIIAGEGASKSALNCHVDVCWGIAARRRILTVVPVDMV